MTNARRHWLAGLLGAALICGPAAMAASDEGFAQYAATHIHAAAAA